jgi:hypothetical protein
VEEAKYQQFMLRILYFLSCKLRVGICWFPKIPDLQNPYDEGGKIPSKFKVVDNQSFSMVVVEPSITF